MVKWEEGSEGGATRVYQRETRLCEGRHMSVVTGTSEAEMEASLDPRISGQFGKHSEPSPEGREGGRKGEKGGEREGGKRREGREGAWY